MMEVSVVWERHYNNAIIHSKLQTVLVNQLCSVLPLCVEVQQSLCLLHGPECDAPFIQSSGEIVTLFVLCHTEVAGPSS